MQDIQISSVKNFLLRTKKQNLLKNTQGVSELVVLFEEPLEQPRMRNPYIFALVVRKLVWPTN